MKRYLVEAGCCRVAIASLMVLLTLEGCVSDGITRTTRFTFEALESRCGVPTIKQLTALPSLPLEKSELDRDEKQTPSAGVGVSPASNRLVKILGLERALQHTGFLEREPSINPAQSAALLWRHQQIMDRISLASFDVISTVTELDCEEARADHVADGLTELRQDKQERGLFLALVGDALIGVVAGALSLAGKATAASANAILGGVLATGIGGAATIFLDVDHEFYHPRNHLAELWQPMESSLLFPDSVWRYLTRPRPFSDETIRDELIARWMQEGRFENSRHEGDRHQALQLGPGGRYDIRSLRVRAEMLNHLKSAVLEMGQDLNVLMYEIMAVSPYEETMLNERG